MTFSHVLSPSVFLPPRFFRFGILAVLLSVCFSAHSACANAVKSDSLFVPTSGWLVGPASLLESISGMKVPCVVANQFHNGYMLRFSGGDDEVLALAIDFRQNAFESGARYAAEISVLDAVGNSKDFKLSASAHNKTTLLINTQKHEGLYSALRDGKILSMDLGRGAMRFALSGLGQGFDRMNRCYNPDYRKAEVNESDLDNSHKNNLYVPRARAVTEKAGLERLSHEGVDPAYIAEIKNIAGENDKEIQAPRPSEKPEFSESQNHEKADKNLTSGVASQLALVEERLNALSGRLSAIDSAAGIKNTEAGFGISSGEPDASAPKAPAKKKDLSAQDKIGKAIGGDMLASLMEKRKGATSYEVSDPVGELSDSSTPATESPDSFVGKQQKSLPKGFYKSNMALPKENIVREAAEQKGSVSTARGSRDILASAHSEVSSGTQVKRWRASKGANLHELLDLWSREQNVRLIWRVQKEYAVQDSFALQGGYEDAVSKVLDQYAGYDDKPVGRLYVDQSLGQKVLVLQESD